jgi:hypothetical protein
MYEFTEQENQVFRSLANRMRFVGYVDIGFSGVSALYAAFLGFTAWRTAGFIDLQADIFAALGATLFLFLTGSWTAAAGKAFQQIVTTQGNDIVILMGGMAQLCKFYTLLFWAHGVILSAASIALMISLPRLLS